MDLLLAAWREVSEHLNIEESCSTISHFYEDRLHHRALILRQLEVDSAHLRTVAQSFEGDPKPMSTFTRLDVLQRDQLVRWCSGRMVAQVLPGEKGPASLALPEDLRKTVLVGPLFANDVLHGVALLVTDRTDELPKRIQNIFRSLLEPLGAALRNDSRLEELERLRNAVEADNQALLKRLGRQDITDAIVGADSGLKEVVQRVAQVGPTDVPVLLFGETGSGKEVIARAIHRASARVSGPMLTVNCGAIPSGLVDSELFGHERGSFTGATGAHKGWFERAEGGTLFLDEVGELPTSVQVRLLRVLQEGVVTRVGGHAPIRVDVRVVAATHRDLHRMVQEGKFREDLWYRLSIFPLYLPPLRERKHDIPALAAHFAVRSGKRMGGQPLLLTKSDISLLMNYDWPGNVRELNAVIERAAILGNGRQLFIARALGHGVNGERENGGENGDTLLVKSKPDQASGKSETASTQGVVAPATSSGVFPTLDEVMREHMEQALQLTRGVVEGEFGAAKLLDINPHTLRSKMRKLQVDWKAYRNPFGPNSYRE